MHLEMLKQREKEKLLENVGEMYRASKEKMKEQDACIKERNGIYKCLEVKERIDRILYSLPLEYALLIEKEFLQAKKQEGWQKKYFREEEYIAYKKAAVDTFLRCLYG